MYLVPTGRSPFLVHTQKQKDEQIEEKADHDGATQQCIHDQTPSLLGVIEIQTVRNELTHLEPKTSNCCVLVLWYNKPGTAQVGAISNAQK